MGCFTAATAARRRWVDAPPRRRCGPLLCRCCDAVTRASSRYAAQQQFDRASQPVALVWWAHGRRQATKTCVGGYRRVGLAVGSEGDEARCDRAKDMGGVWWTARGDERRRRAVRWPRAARRAVRRAEIGGVAGWARRWGHGAAASARACAEQAGQAYEVVGSAIRRRPGKRDGVCRGPRAQCARSRRGPPCRWCGRAPLHGRGGGGRRLRSRRARRPGAGARQIAMKAAHRLCRGATRDGNIACIEPADGVCGLACGGWGQHLA